MRRRWNSRVYSEEEAKNDLIAETLPEALRVHLPDARQTGRLLKYVD